MAEPASIGLIGAGAVGSLLASALIANGVQFSWVVRNAARREQLGNGLPLRVTSRQRGKPGRVHTAGPAADESAGTRQLRLPLIQITLLETAGDLPALDWLIIAVKAQQVDPLLAQLRGVASYRLLVVANGLQSGPFLLGVLDGGAYVAPSGELVTTDGNQLVIGELGPPPYQDDPPLNLLTPLLCPWLFPIPDSHIHERMWLKLAKNCVINPLSALLDVPNGELLPLLESPLVTGVITELHELIHAEVELQEPLSRSALLDSLRSLLVATAHNSSSMREDLRHGRETEIRRMNLAVADRGERRGIPCQLTRALGQAVLALETVNR